MSQDSSSHSTGGLRQIFESTKFTWAARPDHARRRLELLRRTWRAKEHQLLLDVGCGGAEATSMIADALGVKAIGLDWATSALSRARSKGLLPVQAGVDGTNLPFASDSFDIVIMSEVIEHLVGTDHAVVEMRRVLRPGGTLLMTTPNLAAWFNRALLLFGVQPLFSEVSQEKVFGRPGHAVVGHLRLFTHRALVEFLVDKDFTDVVVEGAPYHDVPRQLRWLDRAVAHWPPGAASLIVSAHKPVE